MDGDAAMRSGEIGVEDAVRFLADACARRCRYLQRAAM